jgi:hypothetical protein
MKFLKVVRQILSGGFLTTNRMRSYYPFLLFIAVLALVWIAINYSAINTLKKITATEKALDVATDKLQKQQNIYTQNSIPSKLLAKLEKTSDSAKMERAHSNIYKIVVKE